MSIKPWFFICIFLVACNSKQTHVALGTLERDRIAHTATINEVVIELPVTQGSIVEKGAVLVRLDDTQQKTIVAKAQAEVMQAQANMDKLRNGAREEEVAAASAKVAGAKASLTQGEANYQRTKQLAKKNLVSQAALDRTIANRDSALANLKTAQEQLLELTNGTRIEDLRIGEAHVLASIAMLNSEKKKLADLTITATRPGILDSLPWNLGERVTTGSPLAIVLAGEVPFARVYIPAPYRVKINIGDQLMVRVDGIKQAIPGTVRWIASEPAFSPYYALNQEERARLMYLAEVLLPTGSANLPSGIPAQVELP